MMIISTLVWFTMFYPQAKMGIGLSKEKKKNTIINNGITRMHTKMILSMNFGNVAESCGILSLMLLKF